MMTTKSQDPVIFLAFGNDRDRHLRDLSEEAPQVRRALGNAEREGRCERVERANAMLDDILEVFQDSAYIDRIAVFHSAGTRTITSSCWNLLQDSRFGRWSMDCSPFWGSRKD
jgi:hypothetical protein